MKDRCDAIVTRTEDQKAEENIITGALKTCGYPNWSITKVKRQIATKKAVGKPKVRQSKRDKSRGHVVLPYIKGLSEKLSRILKDHQVSTSYKPHTTLRRLLVHPKDKIPKEDTCDVVYQIPCLNCDEVYIGETGRQMKTRQAEHQQDIEDNAVGVRTRSERGSTSGEKHKSAIPDT